MAKRVNALTAANYDALDKMADMIAPLTAIVTDAEALEAWRGMRRTEAVMLMIRNHKAEVIEVLAALDGVPVAEYELKPDEVVVKLLARLGMLSKLIKAVFPARQAAGDDAGGDDAGGDKAE